MQQTTKECLNAYAKNVLQTLLTLGVSGVRRAQNNLADVNDDANHYSEAGGGVNFDEIDMF